MLICFDYVQLNRNLHAAGRLRHARYKWLGAVNRLIERYNPEAILDHGCGQGALGHPMTRMDGSVKGSVSSVE